MLALVRLASGQYSRILVGLLASPLLARSLGASGRGTWALIVTFDIATTVVIGTGFGQAFSYFYRTATTDQERTSAVASATSGLRVVFIRAALIAPVVLVGALMLFSTTIAVATCLLVLATPSTLFNSMSRHLAGLEHRDTRYALIDGGPATIQALTIICLALLDRLTLTSGLTVLVVVRFLSFLPGLTLWPTREREPIPREFRSYGLRALPAALAQLAQGRVSELAVVPLGTEAVGQFAVGATLSGLLNPLYLATYTRTFRERDTEQTTAATAVKRLLPLVPVAVVMGVIGYFLIVPVYGDEYEAGRAVALWLSIGSIGFGLFVVSRALLDRVGRPGLVSAIQIAHVVAVFAIIPPLVLSQGLAVAAACICVLQFIRGINGLIAYAVVRRRLPDDQPSA